MPNHHHHDRAAEVIDGLVDVEAPGEMVAILQMALTAAILFAADNKPHALNIANSVCTDMQAALRANYDDARAVMEDDEPLSNGRAGVPYHGD